MPKTAQYDWYVALPEWQQHYFHFGVVQRKQQHLRPTLSWVWNMLRGTSQNYSPDACSMPKDGTSRPPLQLVWSIPAACNPWLKFYLLGYALCVWASALSGLHTGRFSVSTFKWNKVPGNGHTEQLFTVAKLWSPTAQVPSHYPSATTKTSLGIFWQTSQPHDDY